ncbi:MAG TPA: PDZ domain-containing protein, partial [Thermomicrobiales bacterium]|nr:PDZ domain-containing protein [Thermomicrobiales bacterium]
MSDPFPQPDPESPSTTKSPRRSRGSLPAIHWYTRMAAVFAMVLIVGVAGGMLVERNIIAQPKPSTNEFDDLDAVAGILEDDYYYRPTDPTEAATWTTSLEQQAINGMLSSLDDQYTRYLNPPDARSASNQLAGTYQGVGISVGTSNDTVIVTAVTAGGPAAKAGILKGDVVVSVDGRNVYPGDDVAGMIQGPAGSQVKIEIERGAATQSTTFSLTRVEIVTPPVSYHIVPGTKIADIDIDIFG